MSSFRDLVISIQEDIADDILDFSQIAQKYGVDIGVVNVVWRQMLNFEESDKKFLTVKNSSDIMQS